MPIRDLSENDYQRAMKERDNMGADPNVRRSNSNFQAGLGALSHAFDDVARSLAPLIELMGYFLKGLSFWIKWFSVIVEFLFGWLRDLNNWFRGIEDGAGNKLKDAADKFDSAVDKWTNKTGTFGGGNRAKGPIPRGWTWYENQSKLIDMAGDLGAFEF
jgi:hypothetical protein